jgi:hypothetical protein
VRPLSPADGSPAPACAFWFVLEFVGPLAVAAPLAAVCATPPTVKRAAAIAAAQSLLRFVAGISLLFNSYLPLISHAKCNGTLQQNQQNYADASSFRLLRKTARLLRQHPLLSVIYPQPDSFASLRVRSRLTIPPYFSQPHVLQRATVMRIVRLKSSET